MYNQSNASPNFVDFDANITYQNLHAKLSLQGRPFPDTLKQIIEGFQNSGSGANIRHLLRFANVERLFLCIVHACHALSV